MKKVKYILAVAMLTVGLTSCGLFKKDCNCPHFGNIKSTAQKAMAV
ncbi:hypothetical protein ACFQZI_15080 [Mucilaginibacter lutimaris]|uniref:Lipoprotein n=1 Tax=Mucilaginibacter lutimaris TaxID=931629 RepID=A0ABW2ZIX3_9SPHI